MMSLVINKGGCIYDLVDTYVHKGKVVYIVDGDTFDLDVDLGFFVTVRIRVLGIDAPELHGATKKAALISKQFLIDNILNKDVIIVSNKQDLFRRCLADVYYKDVVTI